MSSATTAASLQLNSDCIERCCAEAEIYRACLPLAGAHVLELGCGAAEHTRAMAGCASGIRITALEVDRQQHEKNLSASRPPNIEFEYGGAQAIPEPDASFDIVVMFKSLHHVPHEYLGQAMREIHRVLKPGGLAYISEPVFDGAFNEILRLFHDEQQVRRDAFEAIVAAVDAGTFELVEEIFFNAPVAFADFAEFERKIIHATHSEHRLDAATFEEVKSRMAAAAGPDGIRFEAPMRIDLLRKPD